MCLRVLCVNTRFIIEHVCVCVRVCVCARASAHMCVYECERKRVYMRVFVCLCVVLLCA